MKSEVNLTMRKAPGPGVSLTGTVSVTSPWLYIFFPVTQWAGGCAIASNTPNIYPGACLPKMGGTCLTKHGCTENKICLAVQRLATVGNNKTCFPCYIERERLRSMTRGGAVKSSQRASEDTTCARGRRAGAGGQGKGRNPNNWWWWQCMTMPITLRDATIVIDDPPNIPAPYSAQKLILTWHTSIQTHPPQKNPHPHWTATQN